MKWLALLMVMGCGSSEPTVAEPREKVPGQDRGTVVVHVLDADSGAPVEGASIVVTAPHLGFERRGETDARGEYTASSMSSGNVTVRVTDARYESIAVEDVPVANDKPVDVDVRLVKPGSLVVPGSIRTP